MSEFIHLNSVTEAHRLMGLPKPKHPLISTFKHEAKKDYGDAKITGDLYLIGMKDGVTGELSYGKTAYDFDEGVMTFISPNQTVTPGNIRVTEDSQNWNILFHPDLISSFPLGERIDAYSFFDYDTHEALHLSDEEMQSLTGLVRKLETEINGNKDQHSQKLIVSNLELILDYCKRYYDRQLYTRSNLNTDAVSRFERFLKAYFKAEKQLELGLPSVKYCGEALSMSPNYLSDLLRKESGKSAQDHIHSFVIARAKNLLLSKAESVSQIAYELGFEYPQHFSKLFRSKTGVSPAKYRNEAL